MKNFRRDHPQFSQCGLNCLLCPMNVGGYCPGCGGGEGNQSCAVARCALEKGVGEFCTRCDRFPCEGYGKMMEYDSFVPHSCILQDLKRAEELGLEVYITELQERRAILDSLLNDWNDGRRKGVYCTAVYLLETEDLRRAFEEMQAAVSADASVKEKAITAVSVLEETAQTRGIVLKLNKKPKEK